MIKTEICGFYSLSFLFFSLAFKEIRNAFDLFKLTPDEKNDFPENNQKREEIPLDCNFAEDHKAKENNQVLKERRNTKDEADTWAYIAAEGDQDVLDGVCQADENSGECVCSQFAIFSEQYDFTVLILSHCNLRSENKGIGNFVLIS